LQGFFDLVDAIPPSPLKRGRASSGPPLGWLRTTWRCSRRRPQKEHERRATHDSENGDAEPSGGRKAGPSWAPIRDRRADTNCRSQGRIPTSTVNRPNPPPTFGPRPDSCCQLERRTPATSVIWQWQDRPDELAARAHLEGKWRERNDHQTSAAIAPTTSPTDKPTPSKTATCVTVIDRMAVMFGIERALALSWGGR
jgi:hypothetical protein